VATNTVYIESTVPNAYVSERQDAASVYRREVTWRWWAQQASLFELCTSEATLAELKAGSYAGQQQAVQLVESLPLVEITDEVYAIADAYINRRLGLLSPTIISPEQLWAEDFS